MWIRYQEKENNIVRGLTVPRFFKPVGVRPEETTILCAS